MAKKVARKKRITRKDRRQARRAAMDIVHEVADELGIRARKVARRYIAGDSIVIELLNAKAREKAGEINWDRVKEILQMILEFLAMILPLFLL